MSSTLYKHDAKLNQLILDIKNANEATIPTCRYWLRGVSCLYGKDCHFSHKINERCNFDAIGCFDYSNDQCNYTHLNCYQTVRG